MNKHSDERLSEPVRKVIVGFDGSAQGGDALYLGKAFAEMEGAELHVAFVQWDDNPATEQQRFEQVFSQARRELGAQGFVPHAVKEMSAARGLHELAEDLDADLIVVGSTHRGTVGRIVLGSVAEMLLHGAPCSVVVAPSGHSDRDHYGLGLIGVAYDGTPEARLALTVGADLAQRLDCSLRLIGVVPGAHGGGRISGMAPEYEEILENDLSDRLGEARESVAFWAPSEVVLAHGNPAEVIASQGVDLDLLVIGSRGYGPVRRAFLGGTSADVMRLAPCPVLVTPRGTERTTHIGALSTAVGGGR